MKEEDAVGAYGHTFLQSRREFLRSLPRHLLRTLGAVAKEGIFAFSSKAEEEGLAQNLVARVEISRCHAWTGLICQQCYLACPKRDQAIEMRDQKPVIMTSVCDGCAMCVSACETVNDMPAIRMVSRMSVSVDMSVEKEVAS